MRRIILVIVSLIFAAPAGALEPSTIPFLQSASEAEVERDLSSALQLTLADRDSAGVWRDALQIMRDDRLGTFTRYAAVTRLMSAAVLLSGRAADDLPLHVLTREDVSAMKDTIGFPDESDLIRYLLARGPSLAMAGLRGEYNAVRLAPEGELRLILERVDQPILGLSPDFSSRTLAPEFDPVAKPKSERAKTRRVTLPSIPPIIIAAKAYRQGKRAAWAERPYAALIALEALEDAVKTDPRHMRIVGYNAHITAEKALLEAASVQPLSSELQKEQTEIALKQPSSAFFARVFDEAAIAYANASVPEGDRRNRVWKLWGVAISRFATGEDASASFQEFVGALDETAAPFARIALRFFDALPTENAVAFPDLPAWRDRVRAVVGGSSPDPRERFRADVDFARILETIARPDIAGPFLMTRIAETQGQSLELEYLYLFAPFVRDYCNLISFQMSRHGTWVRISSAGYDPLLDFLDNFHPTGRLTESGEVVRPSAGAIPYPALNPEEDCAVIVAASGVAEGIMQPSVVPKMSADFEDWARQAFERKTPPPSLAPYLKLLYVDWFVSAFEVLKGRRLSASDYRYEPLNASPLASPSLARELLGRATMPAWQRTTLELFLRTHTFLKNNYSG